MQYCPPYWDAPGGRAETYLGDRNAPLTVENQTIVAIKEWTDKLNSLGSGGAVMAAWLKGNGTGQAIAGRDKAAYDHAMAKRDGNGTSVRVYMTEIENHAKHVNVDHQLPF